MLTVQLPTGIETIYSGAPSCPGPTSQELVHSNTLDRALEYITYNISKHVHEVGQETDGMQCRWAVY